MGEIYVNDTDLLVFRRESNEVDLRKPRQMVTAIKHNGQRLKSRQMLRVSNKLFLQGGHIGIRQRWEIPLPDSSCKHITRLPVLELRKIVGCGHRRTDWTLNASTESCDKKDQNMRSHSHPKLKSSNKPGMEIIQILARTSYTIWTSYFCQP